MAGARLFLVSGRVQGVYFRDSARNHAVSLGLTGYAKNLSDGSVEILVCGEQEAISRFETWLQQGPPMARIEKVTGENVEGESRTEFSIT